MPRSTGKKKNRGGGGGIIHHNTGVRCCLCVAPLLFSLILFVQRCSFSCGQASLRCDLVTFTGRRPPRACKSLIVSPFITHSSVSLSLSLSLPPLASYDLPPHPPPLPPPCSSCIFILSFSTTSPPPPGWMRFLPPLRGRPEGEMHRARDSSAAMERHLMSPRWGGQECPSNLQKCADALWERTQGKSGSFQTEKMNTAGCRFALPLLT